MGIVSVSLDISTQAEVVMKQICSSHPYETQKAGEDCLKKEAHKVRREIVDLLQGKAHIAGLHVLNFEFKELSYAPEIAGQMLVRQQAEAMLDARKTVVDGAVEISTAAVENLKHRGIDLTQAEAARLASNLVITICSESRVTPTMTIS